MDSRKEFDTVQHGILVNTFQMYRLEDALSHDLFFKKTVGHNWLWSSRDSCDARQSLAFRAEALKYQ